LREGDRYSRQTRFGPIGELGQKQLSDARVGVAGLGALGSVVADELVRAGIGSLCLIDRDFVELSNLQRQTLYDEQDVAQNLPKAVAAERKLRRINSEVSVESEVDDLNTSNVEAWIEDLDLVVDGLDNFETRFVLNDACRKLGKPWIYGAALGSYGLVLPVLPDSHCLRCVVESLPAAGSSPTCDTVGVIAPITNAIGSLQVSQALRLLTGQLSIESVRLISFDIWSLRFRTLKLPAESRDQCPLCKEGRLDYLSREPLRTVTLCGRNAVQLIPGTRTHLDLVALTRALETYGPVRSNEFLLQCADPPYELTVFRDGRAIVKGTEEPKIAKSVYSRMIGS
jgi:molybdopterin/thiamine biosynthesis adenylyltransferase